MMLYQPIWIKFLWVLPVFGIMVECFERQKDLGMVEPSLKVAVLVHIRVILQNVNTSRLEYYFTGKYFYIGAGG